MARKSNSESPFHTICFQNFLILDGKCIKVKRSHNFFLKKIKDSFLSCWHSFPGIIWICVFVTQMDGKNPKTSRTIIFGKNHLIPYHKFKHQLWFPHRQNGSPRDRETVSFWTQPRPLWLLAPLLSETCWSPEVRNVVTWGKLSQPPCRWEKMKGYPSLKQKQKKPWKWMVGRLFSFWVPVTFQGPAVKLKGG